MSTSTQVRAGSVHARLQALGEAVGAVTGLDLTDLDGPAAAEVFTQVHGLADRLRAVAVQVLPVIEAEGRWALEGHRTAAHWVVHHTGVSTATARRDLRLGRALREELPLTARAVRTGQVGLDHARVLTTLAATSPTRRQALADPDSPCAEAFLVHHARTLPTDPFRSLVRRWAAAADPDADDRGYRDASDREFLDVSATLGGYHLAGFLTPEHGTTLATALAAVTTTPPAGDQRTAAQRRATALTHLARTVLDHALAPNTTATTPGRRGGTRPHLNIHLDATALVPQWIRRLHQAASTDPTEPATPSTAGTGTAGTTGLMPGPATFDDGTPVPLSVLRRLACDSEITRIVLGPDSTILDVGRAARTVTGQLRRAVITRDRHCAYPGCHTPPQHCEIHHPHHWADGGPTSLTNSILLCWHHHDHVHRTHTTITARPTTPTATTIHPRTSPDTSPHTHTGTGTGTNTRAGTSTGTGTSSAATLHPHWDFHDRHGRPIGPPRAPDPRPPPGDTHL